MGAGHFRPAERSSTIDAKAFPGILIIFSAKIWFFFLNSENWGY